MLRRLSELITPPVRKAAPDTTPPAPKEPDLSTALKPLLKKLVSAPALEDPSTQECLNEIKQLALKRGLYVVAFEIRTTTDLMPRTDNDGNPCFKQRGYILAGDFFLSHIRREIDAFRSHTRVTGPNVFRGYCDEMIECLLRCGNVRRAIEIPVTVIDDLLALALADPSLADGALELALQAATSMHTMAKSRFDRESEPNTRSTISSFDAENPFKVMDEQCVGYAQTLLGRIKAIRTQLGQWLADRAKSGNAAPLSPHEFTQAAMAVAKTAQYAGFSGLVMERAASLVPDDPQKAAVFRSKAAAIHEEQADGEIDLFFTKLSGLRYRRAHELYTQAGQAEAAARAQAKFAESATRGKH